MSDELGMQPGKVYLTEPKRIDRCPLLLYYTATLRDESGDIYATCLVFSEIHRQRLGEEKITREAYRVAQARLLAMTSEDRLALKSRDRFKVHSHQMVDLQMEEDGNGLPCWMSE